MNLTNRPFLPFIKKFWIVAVIAISCFYLFFILLSAGVFGYMPDMEELQNPNSFLASEVISADNVVLGKYFQQNRSNAHYQDLPPQLKNALLATEDIRFFSHTGVDAEAIARVFKGVITRDSKGGGSTITQQLAKNLFPREDLNKIQLVFRKFKEWLIAIKLERSFTKEEIMTLYFNTVEFSDNAYGIKTASQTYFSKPTDSLTIEEAAVLVGMLQAPYKYNPRLHPEASLERRNIVLAQMAKYDFITEDIKNQLQAKPIVLKYKQSDHSDGLAPYFRMTLRDYLKEWCKKNKKPDGTQYNIYKDGLKIYTTIDSRMQGYAEQAVFEHFSQLQKTFNTHWKGMNPWKDHPDEWKKTVHETTWYRAYKKAGKNDTEIDALLAVPHKMKVFSYEGEKDTMMSVLDSIKYMRMFLQTGFVAIDPKNGFVKAYVGGINYKYFQLDHCQTARQVGSTFKPFVYTVAMRDKGYSPCQVVPSSPVTFQASDKRWHLVQNWTPKNSGGKAGGMMTLKSALANSVNTVSAYLMHEMTPEAVITTVKDMGITANIPNTPSICLGSADIPLMEMISAYTTYVDNGVFCKPIMIDRIEDKNGNVLQQFEPERKEVLSADVAYACIELMRGVISEGTGKKLIYKYNLKTDIVGKTGTTQNQSDAWFIGLTPDLIAGVWSGCDDRFVRFRTITYGQGAVQALPVWGRFYQKVYADSSFGIDLEKRFMPPENMSIELDCAKYKVTNGGIGVANEEYGAEFDKPTTTPIKDTTKKATPVVLKDTKTPTVSNKQTPAKTDNKTPVKAPVKK
ncbi:MAG: transglycosylase domain-containing protein [Bacteroidota bacterium]